MWWHSSNWFKAGPACRGVRKYVAALENLFQIWVSCFLKRSTESSVMCFSFLITKKLTTINSCPTKHQSWKVLRLFFFLSLPVSKSSKIALALAYNCFTGFSFCWQPLMPNRIPLFLECHTMGFSAPSEPAFHKAEEVAEERGHPENLCTWPFGSWLWNVSFG